MFSLEMMYATLGDPAWADLTEKIAYNAMPAQVLVYNIPLHSRAMLEVCYRSQPTGGRNSICIRPTKFGLATTPKACPGRTMSTRM